MDLETGKFDPDFNEPDPEGSSSVKESNTNGDSAMNGAETSTIAADEESKPNGNGDDEMQFNVEVEDENGDQDAGRMDSNGRAGSDPKRLNRGEEISVQPEGNQVMIRTIPPDIGRLKLEEVSTRDSQYHLLALTLPFLGLR